MVAPPDRSDPVGAVGATMMNTTSR